jgi:hypothetical protein
MKKALVRTSAAPLDMRVCVLLPTINYHCRWEQNAYGIARRSKMNCRVINSSTWFAAQSKEGHCSVGLWRRLGAESPFPHNQAMMMNRR